MYLLSTTSPNSCLLCQHGYLPFTNSLGRLGCHSSAATGSPNLQKWSLKTPALTTTTTEDTIKFTAQYKLLENSSMCEVCNRLRTIHHQEGLMGPSGSAQIVNVLVGGQYATTVSSLAASCSRCSSSPSFTTRQQTIRCTAAERSLVAWQSTHKPIGGLMCRGVCEDWLIAHSTQIGGITVNGNLSIVLV